MRGLLPEFFGHDDPMKGILRYRISARNLMAYGEAVDPINLYRVVFIQFRLWRAFKMAMHLVADLAKHFQELLFEFRRIVKARATEA